MHSVELVYVAHLGHMVHVIRQVNVDSHDSLGGECGMVACSSWFTECSWGSLNSQGNYGS